MRVLHKYLVKEFVRYFAIFEAVFAFLYLVVDFLGKIDNFIEAKAPESTVFLYFLYKIPFISVNMTSATVAITVIVMFIVMKNNREIAAMKACGINLFGIARLFVLVAAVVALGTFLVSEILVPAASSRSNRIWRKEVNKQDPGLFYGSRQV